MMILLIAGFACMLLIASLFLIPNLATRQGAKKTRFNKFTIFSLLLFIFFCVGFYGYQGNFHSLKITLAQEAKEERIRQMIKALGSTENIIKKFKQYVSEHPNDPKAWDLLGKLQSSQRNYVAARQSFLNAMQHSPNTPEYQAHYSEVNFLLTHPKQIQLPLRITLSKIAATSIDSNAVLFVYAKAIKGPPMPLAIQRIEHPTFPMNITLDDTMNMLPNVTLKQYRTVQLIARLSLSGAATPQSGDWIGEQQPITIHPRMARMTIEIKDQMA